MAKMKESTRKIFDFLKTIGNANYTADDIAAATGIPSKSVNGSVTSFAKKGLAVRTEAAVELADGSTKTVKFISLTPEGMAFDPDAEQAE